MSPTSSGTGVGEPPPARPSPPARRDARSGWRDPRLAVGVLVVAASVLLGVRVVGGADDAVGVWAAARDLHKGEVISADDLVRRSVGFEGSRLASRYVAADSPVADLTVHRDVAAGEMLPRTAVRPRQDAGLLAVPIAAPVTAVPATLHVGSVVDVWVVPDPSEPGAAATPGGRSGPRRGSPVDLSGMARIAFDDVRVLRLPAAGNGLAPRSQRQIVVGFPSGDHDGLAAALTTAAQGSLVVIEQG